MAEESSNRKLTIMLCAAIAVGAAAIAALTFLTEPTAKRGGATKKTAMLVETVRAERGTYRPRIVAQGTVQPEQDVTLSPQVGGRVVAIAPEFTPGGFVEAGDLLLRIEAADFSTALALRKSELQQAAAELALEEGRRVAAKAEYDYIDEALTAENEALVLRQPQLDAAKERVAAAQASVEQAELNLRRTAVRAPFDAQVIRRGANVGSQVAPGQDIGRLVGVETYWVGVELPLSKLRWISIAQGDREGSEVRVQNRQAWPEDAFREGRLVRLIGALDGASRMARVLAAIPDPLGSEPRLMIGEFVEVRIEGEPLEDVVRLKRDLVREDDTVWVMQDKKLRIAQVEVVVRDVEYAYIASGLEGGEAVVTTNLATVVDGAPLRTEASGE